MVLIRFECSMTHIVSWYQEAFMAMKLVRMNRGLIGSGLA
ncbi:hypothetical protein LMG33818_001607 [Halomonadaceae bacterium LMG 33818]